MSKPTRWILMMIMACACKVSTPVKQPAGTKPSNPTGDTSWDMNLLNTAAGSEYLDQAEKDVILEVNKLRSNPARYAELYLVPYKQYYSGRDIEIPGRITIVTKEGVAPLNQCIEQLKNSKPLPILDPAKGLCRAAGDQARDQGKTGNVGHTGSDGSTMTDRINRYGKWNFKIGENIDYGHNIGREVVIALLIDDGVTSRGHRQNLLDASFHKIGVAIGSHPVYNYVSVMDFAGDYQ